MKAWVWDEEGVLEDYTSGLVVVIGAETEEEAWEMLKVEDSGAYACLHPDYKPRLSEPKEVLVVWGGG